MILLLLYAGYAIMSPEKHRTERFVSISVDKDTLYNKDKTSFHVSASDDNLLFSISYDKNLLTINTTDSVIRRVKTAQPILKDSVTVVKICDSIKITLKRMVPFKEGSLLPNPKTPIIVQKVTENGGDGGSPDGGITLSNGTSNGQVTGIK